MNNFWGPQTVGSKWNFYCVVSVHPVCCSNLKFQMISLDSWPYLPLNWMRLMLAAKAWMHFRPLPSSNAFRRAACIPGNNAPKLMTCPGLNLVDKWILITPRSEAHNIPHKIPPLGHLHLTPIISKLFSRPSRRVLILIQVQKTAPLGHLIFKV